MVLGRGGEGGGGEGVLVYEAMGGMLGWGLVVCFSDSSPFHCNVPEQGH